MASNDWINGYLEAILDAGDAAVASEEQIRGAPKSLIIQERGNFNPTRYFVDEVVGYDETDLHRTWVKTTAMRNSQERNVRLENLCWRIWHLTRRKKQVAWDEMQRQACRQHEHEQGLKDATEDFSEDLSEGEKVDFESSALVATQKFTRNLSDLEVPPIEQQHSQKKTLYIVLISVHGLVRGENMELGRDSDTGGQVKYVVELAKALATMREVYRVDLLTRQISSPEVDWSYGEPTEMLSSAYNDGEFDGAGESSGAYIVRIPCGPRDNYLHKELLWPYVQEFVDGALTHILNMAKVLSEQINDGEKYVWPYVIHGHYADAGDIAALLSGALNVPMVLTGHSLGRNKLEQLLKPGRQSIEEINSTYKIMRRIEAEELSLDAAELVITSTQQEIDDQWGLYHGFDVKLAKILRLRTRRGDSCHGRYMPRMVVIPPGMDFSNVIPLIDLGESGEVDLEADSLSPRIEPSIWSEIGRFFNNPHKPMILALARPDPKKNITTLVKAFAECRALRDLANLTLIMGNRDDIDEMPGGNAAVLTTILKLIDKYDLYGQVAYPKHHKQSDVPDIYRLAARTKGVFINPALVEPFGLTLIEAAAHGLPMVATKNGGPVDIQRALNNGVLVDPHDQTAIADALLRLVSDRNLWTECRRSGLKNIHLFSWPQHCRTYLSRIALCRMRHPQWQDDLVESQIDEDSQGDSLRDAHDISLRLSVDDKIIAKVSEDGEAELRNRSTTSNIRKNFEKFRKETLQHDDTNGLRRFPSTEKVALSNGNKVLTLRKKRAIFVVAVDCYDASGNAGSIMPQLIKEVFTSAKKDSSAGLVLSTAMTLAEAVNVLNLGGFPLQEFNALICSSGSEIYYPAVTPEETALVGSAIQFYADPDYAEHIDYRWGAQGLEKTATKLISLEREKSGSKDCQHTYAPDKESSNSHCLAYQVKDPSQVLRVDELRKKFRMRGLRCHVIYCRRNTKLHILPLLASRAQALRYLFVRWGADVSKMHVFVGESGDTDYEEQLSGMHKTIIISQEGVVEDGCDQLLRGSGSYQKQDVVPIESPNIVTIKSITTEAIDSALKKLA